MEKVVKIFKNRLKYWKLSWKKNLPLVQFFNFLGAHFSRTASFEITLVHLSVCPSACLSLGLSLSFLKIGSLFFLILYMMIADHELAEPEFWKKKKKNWQPEFGPYGPKSGSKLGFLPFSQVWFISFPWNCMQW